MYEQAVRNSGISIESITEVKYIGRIELPYHRQQLEIIDQSTIELTSRINAVLEAEELNLWSRDLFKEQIRMVLKDYEATNNPPVEEEVDSFCNNPDCKFPACMCHCAV